MNIQQNISLKQYNTFQIDAQAKYFIEISSKEEFLQLMQEPIFQKNKKLIIGWGSNMLLINDFDWLVILNKIQWKKTIAQDDRTIELAIWWGENRHKFVMRACTQGYTWIENLALIPWSVGASPIQNIWAYGVEAKDTITQLWWINIETWQYQVLTNKSCQFGYRDSIFKNSLKDKFFVTDVTFMLKKTVNKEGENIEYVPNIEYAGVSDELEKQWIQKETLTPLQVANIISIIRGNKLPDRTELWTAGSFFKNPIISKEELEIVLKKDETISYREVENDMIKLSAGQLIDKAWLKWHKIGNASTYEKHALVLVNLGGATGAEIKQLAKFIQQQVLEKFGIRIEPEVNYIE